MAGLRLMAELGLDGSGFEAGIKRAEGVAHGVAEGLKSFVVQAIGVLTVEQAISKTVETAKELVETSKRLSIAPEQLQLMRQAAKDAGVELGDVAKFIEKIDIARQKALLRQGVEPIKMRQNFARLGVSQEMLHTMTGAQLMMGPLSQTAQGRNSEELGALFRSMGLRDFGPMIAVLKTNFTELEKEMRKWGGIIDTEALVSIKSFSEELDLLTTVIISHLAPALVWMAEQFYKAAAIVASFGSYLGAVTSKISGADLIKVAINPSTLPNVLAKLAPEEGKKAAESTALDWIKALDAIKKRIAEDADKLKHPTPANFDQSSLPENISAKALETHADSMTKVGNFLGGMGIAAQIEQKKVELLTRIATASESLAAGWAKSGGSVYDPRTEGPIVKGPFRMLSGDTHFPH